MGKKENTDIGELLDAIDAAPLLGNRGSSGGSGGCLSCGGKCYQGCKASTPLRKEYNLPNIQPSLDRTPSAYKNEESSATSYATRALSDTSTTEPTKQNSFWRKTQKEQAI